MFCHKCGHKSPEDAAFCQKCGEKLIEDKEILISPVAITNPISPGSKKMHKKLIIGFAGIAIAIITIIAIVLNLGGDTEYPDELLYEGLPVSRFLEMTRDDFITEFGEPDQSDPDYPGIRYDDKGISLINFSEETGKMIHMNFYSENCTFNGKKFVDTTTEKAMKNISTPEGTQITPSNIIEYSLYSKINQVTNPKYKFFRVIEKDHTIEYITYEDYVMYMFLYSNQLDRFVGDESASLGSEADSADAYPGELLYRGEAIANLLGSKPEDLNKIFGAPTGGTPVTGELLYGATEYYTYDGIGFMFDEQKRIINIAVNANALELNGKMLNQDRAGIINMLGTPGFEGEIPEDEAGEGLGGYYIMEYTFYDDQTIITLEMPDADSKANSITIARYNDGSGDEEYLESNGNAKHFNIVLCPSHMTKKWVREIEESLPNTFAVVVMSISEINTAYEAYQKDTKTCYIIISKEKARDGYMRRPSVIWNQRRKAFICPTCHEPVMMDLIDDGSKYRVSADQFFFKRENKQNHKCDCCGSLLWTALVPEQQSEWVKVSDLGFVHRRFAEDYLDGCKGYCGTLSKKSALCEAIQAIVDAPDGNFPNTGAYRRFPLSTYIKRHMKGKIDGLIIDELHNYNNNSGQGDAMGELFGAAKRVVGMTATLINGYSSGIFHLLYRISPDLMLKDGKSYDKSTEFNSEYGVTESIYEIAAPDYNSNRRTSKKKIRERQLPGVSPLVYSRFLMDSAAFLSLNDMGKDLPDYEEIPVQLQMNEEVALEYYRLERQFKDVLRSQKDIAKKVLAAYLGLLTVYPDQPYDQKSVVHPITGDDLVVPQDVSSFNELHEKDRSVLDVVERKTAEGGRVLIYTSWTRIDSQQKLSGLLEENGYRVAILKSGIPPNRREEWVEKQVADGIQVLITNPSLVETGLDLNDFTTLYYYNIAYNLFTLRQSSRRSWRINQKAPKVEVYFSYYEGTMQHRAIRLMASKLAVAGIIEGNFTDEGLAAMSDCADMTTALARELTQGIKNEVEDLGAVFKKMAKLKPSVGDIEVIDTKNTMYTINTSTAIMPAEIITENLYDPCKVKNLDMGLAENIENTALQKLQQFKITDFPVDFDPFAEDMAA